MNRGTRISRPVCSVAGLVTPPLAVSPRTPGSVDVTVSSTCGGDCKPMGVPLYFCTCTTRVSTSSSPASPTFSSGRVGVSERALTHEMEAGTVGVHERRIDRVEIGLGEFLAGFERLVEDRARKQVPHLHAHECLATAGGRLRDLDVDAVVGRVFELKKHLPLDV